MDTYSTQVINAAFEWVRLDEQYVRAMRDGQEQEARLVKHSADNINNTWNSRYGNAWSALVSQIREQVYKSRFAA